MDVSGNSQFSGTITVGVDDTGKDVKLFGASAGAYMEWDESADQLRIMGASADATTSTGKLLLATSLTDINANDVIGKIEFQAPHEAGGTDAIAVAASIQAIAQATFTSSVNATDLIFNTGHSEAAAEKIRFTSQGEIGIGGANYGTDGQVMTSAGAGAAVAWEDIAAGSGAYDLNGETLTLDADGDTLLKANVDDQIIIEMSGGSRQVITTDGKVLIGDTASNQEAYPGMVLNSGAGDGRIVDFKSSDVAHGITDQTETDNWGSIVKGDAARGSMHLSGYSEGSPAMQLNSYYTGSNATYTTSGISAIKVYTALYVTGTQVTNPGAGDNLFGVYSLDLMRFSVDQEGDIHYDGSASAYDHYDDAHLVRALDTFKAPEAIIQGKFDKFVKYNRSTLEDSGVLYKCTPEERERGETPFICITKLQKLHNGAIWQQYTKHNQLLEAVYDLAKEAVGEDKANAILEKHEVKRLQ